MAKRRNAKIKRTTRDDKGQAGPSEYGAGVAFGDNDLMPATDGENVAAEDVEETNAALPAKKPRLCGLCRAPGHQARTCPERAAEPAAEPPAADVRVGNDPPAGCHPRRLRIM